MKELAQAFAQRYWSDGLDRRLPVAAALLAILLLTSALAELTWQIVPSAQQNQSTFQQSSQSGGLPVATADDKPVAQKIANWHLFGKPEPKREELKPVEQKVIPPTKLNLKLRGVFASDNDDADRAIIADAKGDEESYRVGENLPGGAMLTEIHTDKVIIEFNGRLETLLLPVDVEEDGSDDVATGRSIPPRGTSSTRTASAPVIDPNADNGALLRQYRDALLTDPQSVMGAISVRPYNKDGRLVGYRLRPGKDRALLRRFGLRSGDIVTSVNGVPMDNPVKALEILRDLSSATQLTVDIERNGTPQSFTFQIGQ